MRTNTVTSVVAFCAPPWRAGASGGSPRWIIAGTAASVHGAGWTAGVMMAALALSAACLSAHAQTTTISGSAFSGSQTFDATSGTAVITGNATLSADTTFNLGFQLNYLVVGGGGGGGSLRGGGGGGGAVVTGSTFLTGNANVYVGGGGTGGVGATNSTAGVNSTISTTLLGTITGTGGQGGTVNRGFGGASGNGNAGGGGGGGGGGAGAAVAGNNGGNGVAWAFGDGTLYGAGGGGYLGLGGADGGGRGGGLPGIDGFGAGGGGGTQGGGGGSGTVKFAYLGGQTGTATNGSQTAGTGAAAGYTVVDYSTVGGGSFEVTSAELANRLAATVTGTLTGSGGLAFGGPGSLTLTGNNLYTGPTTVNGGSLFVNGQVNSPVTVSGSSLLGGSGTVAGAVGVATGGTLAPGATAGSTGRLSMTSLTGTSYTIALAINGTTPGTDYDQISATTLDYSGATLAVSLTGSYADGTAWDLFDFTTQSGTLAGISPLTASLPAYNGLTWDLATTSTSVFDQRYGTGIWLSTWSSGGQRFIFNQANGVLTVVPEPSTFAMAAAGLAGCVLLRRRRAQKAARKPATTGSSRSGSR